MVTTKAPEVEKAYFHRNTWEAFSDAGQLWFANRILHVFGWVIVVESDGTAYPARTNVLGFPEEADKEYVAKFRAEMEKMIAAKRTSDAL